MAIPDYQSIMLPLLKYAGDGKEHKFGNSIEDLADKFALSDEEITELLPSGLQPVLRNRVAWACTYLKKAGLLNSERKGYFTITQKGLSVLKENPVSIDVNFLTKYKEFNEFRRIGKQANVVESDIDKPDMLDPEEALEVVYNRLHNELVSAILSTVKQCSPKFFENMVIDVLTKMGYGGSRKDVAEAVGKSHDGGIDGIIKQDILGLDVIYIQAKRWEGTVSSPEIQKFAGALKGKQAKKGVFITTSKFSREAIT
jgi:restriction system protein